MKILITGFEPFGGWKENISWEVAREVAASGEFDGRLIAVRLPVSFSQTPAAIHEAMRLHNPDAVLMLGFSSKREKISVERVAINIIDAKIPDNEGVQPVDVEVSKNGPAALFATLPIKRMLSAMQDGGIDAVISNSAGTYVCNEALYTALNYAKRLKNHPLAGFVHLPPVDRETAVRAVKLVVKNIL